VSIKTDATDGAAPRGRPLRRVETIRAGWGAALLISPDHIVGTVHGLHVDPKSRAVARILGARHLVQAALSGVRPSAEVLAMGVWVDVVHALSALGLALVDRHRARAGLTDAVVAALWAAAGHHDLGRATATPSAQRSVRDRLAILVLSHAPAGRALLRRAGDR
jgi:hypothetical protein